MKNSIHRIGVYEKISVLIHQAFLAYNKSFTPYPHQKVSEEEEYDPAWVPRPLCGGLLLVLSVQPVAVSGKSCQVLIVGTVY